MFHGSLFKKWNVDSCTRTADSRCTAPVGGPHQGRNNFDRGRELTSKGLSLSLSLSLSRLFAAIYFLKESALSRSPPLSLHESSRDKARDVWYRSSNFVAPSEQREGEKKKKKRERKKKEEEEKETQKSTSFFPRCTAHTRSLVARDYCCAREITAFRVSEHRGRATGWLMAGRCHRRRQPRVGKKRRGGARVVHFVRSRIADTEAPREELYV